LNHFFVPLTPPEDEEIAIFVGPCCALVAPSRLAYASLDPRDFDAFLDLCDVPPPFFQCVFNIRRGLPLRPFLFFPCPKTRRSKDASYPTAPPMFFSCLLEKYFPVLSPFASYCSNHKPGGFVPFASGGFVFVGYQAPIPCKAFLLLLLLRSSFLLFFIPRPAFGNS